MLLTGEEKKKCFRLHIHLNSLKYQNSVKEWVLQRIYLIMSAWSGTHSRKGKQRGVLKTSKEKKRMTILSGLALVFCSTVLFPPVENNTIKDGRWCLLWVEKKTLKNIKGNAIPWGIHWKSRWRAVQGIWDGTTRGTDFQGKTNKKTPNKIATHT